MEVIEVKESDVLDLKAQDSSCQSSCVALPCSALDSPNVSDNKHKKIKTKSVSYLQLFGMSVVSAA